MKAKIKFLNAEKMREMSFGEVQSPHTLNFRSRIPQIGGLLCPKIFGPIKDYRCNCQPPVLKGRQHRGMTCGTCGVTVMPAAERRARSGHIELPVPVVHPLAYLILSDVMGIPLQKFQRIIDGKLWAGWVPSEEGYIYLKNGNCVEAVVHETRDMVATKRSSMGLYHLVQEIDVDATYHLQRSLGRGKTAGYLGRVLEQEARLEDLFISVLPVMPVAYRPYLDKGDWVITSAKNVLYTRVFWYKLRFHRLRDLWPLFGNLEIIIQEEATFLQKAVNELLLYGRADIKGGHLKSIVDDIKGKMGIVRNKLLGKRIDFSGRSVISPGPWLKLDEMGLPRKMGIQLFKPWIQHWLYENYDLTTAQSEAIYKKKKSDVRLLEALDDIIKDKVLIMNRAPTLHRIGMLAFKIRLHDGHSCFLHPMVCAPYNADFDGDQMAVHIPIGQAVVQELKDMMSPEDNMLSPLDSSPVIGPSHEMIIGTYLMTKISDESAYGTYDSELRIIQDHERGMFNINTPIILREGPMPEDTRTTCAGRLMFERLFKMEINYPLTKKTLKRLISDAYDHISRPALVLALDKMKTLAYKYVTEYGFSVGMDDFHIPTTRDQKMADAQAFADELATKAQDGIITEEERVEGKIRRWMGTLEEIQDDFIEEAGELNPLVVMLETGARVSMTQVSQLVVSKGMQARANGSIMEDPVHNCLMTGVNTFEYFLTSYGARKSMADKKTATPKSGYLARRLVNVARDFYISVKDCGNDKEGISIPRNKAYGRTTLSGEVLGRSSSTDFVKLRSPVFCTAERGICETCFGIDATTRNRVKVGEPVGVIAAQSLTEPCTQMTMKTFHTSGAAELKDSPLVVRAAQSGTVRIDEVMLTSNTSIWVDGQRYEVHDDLCKILVKNGEHVQTGSPLAIYTSQNLLNQDIAGKLDVLEQYYELTAVKGFEAVVAHQEGPVQLLAEEDAIAILINGELQGQVYETPVFVHDGQWVRKGQFLSYGEANIKALAEDIELAGNVFVNRMLELYAEEGVNSYPVHLEMIFRGMSELIEDDEEPGKLGLFRYGDTGTRRVFGSTEAGRLYPSWLKAIGFGYSKMALMRAAINFSTTYDLPTERIMMGEYPLFDPVEENDG